MEKENNQETVKQSNIEINLLMDVPLEIAVMILKRIDTLSLVRASRVSKEWYHICMSEPNFRKRIQRYLRKLARRPTLYSPATRDQK